MEAHFIANKDEIQADHFNSEVCAQCFGLEKAFCLWTSCLKGSTINAGVYCDTLTKFRRAIHNKRRGMLSPGVVMIHENARPHTHTAAATQNLVSFDWEQFDHPPFSPDLAPSDFHLFLHPKILLCWRPAVPRQRGQRSRYHVLCIAGGIVLR